MFAGKVVLQSQGPHSFKRAPTFGARIPFPAVNREFVHFQRAASRDLVRATFVVTHVQLALVHTATVIRERIRVGARVVARREIALKALRLIFGVVRFFLVLSQRSCELCRKRAISKVASQHRHVVC